jgi:hypothetical protein
MAEQAKQDFAKLTAPGAEAKIRSIFDFTAEALEELRSWLEQAGLRTPVSQIIGFTQFAGHFATVGTQETTTSTTYTNLATSGPLIDGLPNGTYLVMTGAVAKSTTGNGAFMSVSLNGAVAQDSAGGETQSTAFTSIIGVSQQTLSAANNSLQSKYKVNAGDTGTYLNRWLFALKLANP